MKDQLVLKVNNRELSGWQSVKVTRGVERCPSDFDILLTERIGATADEMLVHPGESCEVFIGDDRVITGYIDRYTSGIDAQSHTVRIIGRGKCQDLVDCSAIKASGQFSNSNVFKIAEELAKEYGIKVINLSKAALPQTPQFNLNLGETPYEIIERLCRYSGLLVYDAPDGNLVLASVGKGVMSGAIEEEKNLERASITHGMDQRFSEYSVFTLGCDTFQDVGSGGNLQAQVQDQNVPRKRYKYIIADAGSSGLDQSEKRALWEAARRFGRSITLNLTVDGWRDDTGVLWEPNYRVKIVAPHILKTITQLKEKDKKGESLSDWVIAEVSYIRDESGTRAELMVMPKEAFMPEPVVLLPGESDTPYLTGGQQ